MDNKKIKIEAIETDAGYYFKIKQNYGDSIAPSLLYDMKKCDTTFCKGWYSLPSIPKKIGKMESQPNINYRYELTDKSFENDTFPLSFKREDVADWDKEEREWIYKEHFRKKYSLYTLKSDEQEDVYVDRDFDFKVILKIDNIKGYAGLDYPIQRTKWRHEGTVNVTDNDVQHQIIDKICFPLPILPSLPSKLSSKMSYDIIREHVLRNIDRDVAEITSDYNFCFTVKKKIKINDPHIENFVSLFAKKKQKPQKKYITDRIVTVFEMTHDQENYKEYTPIKPFEGKNHEDLKNNINKFLNDLMTEINEPLVDCPYCNGTGVISKGKNE